MSAPGLAPPRPCAGRGPRPPPSRLCLQRRSRRLWRTRPCRKTATIHEEEAWPLTASLTRTELRPASSIFGTRKFLNSELVSWFHGDSPGDHPFYLDQGLAPRSRTSGAVSGLLEMPPAGWRLLGAASATPTSCVIASCGELTTSLGCERSKLCSEAMRARPKSRLIHLNEARGLL